jgi:hypothetical protein
MHSIKCESRVSVVTAVGPRAHWHVPRRCPTAIVWRFKCCCFMWPDASSKHIGLSVYDKYQKSQKLRAPTGFLQLQIVDAEVGEFVTA